uniref:Uncharacterized protein n=1 Tax=Peronospora matthiolae TaxID=2874970 RepID=A0AAV1TNE3_9STRA
MVVGRGAWPWRYMEARKRAYAKHLPAPEARGQGASRLAATAREEAKEDCTFWVKHRVNNGFECSTGRGLTISAQLQSRTIMLE